MSAAAEAARWRKLALRMHEGLAKHARRCDRCQWPEFSGDRVLVSTDCRDGVLLFTEWVTACNHHANLGADGCGTAGQDHRLMCWPV